MSGEEYSRVETGMSYSQVVDIVGSRGKEMSRTSLGGHTSVTVLWENWDGSNMIVSFSNDRVVTKAQAGLR